MEPILINNWSCVAGQGVTPYTAPECLTIALRGDAVNHPKLGSKNILTSHIVKAEGRIITTASGSVYQLGTVDPDYAKYMEEQDKPINAINPILVKGK